MVSTEVSIIVTQADKEEVGNTEAAKILDVHKSNVHKMLVRYGVEGQEILQGTRKVHVYPREEVIRVRDIRRKRKRMRSKASGNHD